MRLHELDHLSVEHLALVEGDERHLQLHSLDGPQARCGTGEDPVLVSLGIDLQVHPVARPAVAGEHGVEGDDPHLLTAHVGRSGRGLAVFRAHVEQRAAVGVAGHVQRRDPVHLTQGDVEHRPVRVLGRRSTQRPLGLGQGLERHHPASVAVGSKLSHVLPGEGPDVEHQVDPVMVQEMLAAHGTPAPRRVPDDIDPCPPGQ